LEDTLLANEDIEEIENTIKNPMKEEKKIYYAGTGCELLDLVVGGGVGKGYPFGKIINFVGDKSSGKTFLAIEVIASAYHKFGEKNLKWIYDDCESGFSFNTEHLYGFPIIPSLLEERRRSSTVEDAYVNIREFAEGLRKNQLGIYVIDSLDGLKSRESNARADERYVRAINERKGKILKSKMPGSMNVEKPKYLSQEFFPKLSEIIGNTNCLLIIISQVRQNIDPMSFEKYVRNGGKAMDFYCHTVLWLANISKIKNKGRATGIVVKARTTKSKTPRPYREGYFELKFDYGLDNTATCVDFLFDFRTGKGELIKDAKAPWKENKEMNIANLKEFLATNGIEQQYRENIHPKLKKSEVVTWIEEEADEEIRNKFKDEFSDSLSRETLIEYIEDNNLVEELNKRVEEKWEAIESAIATKRKPKYSTP